MFAKFIGKRSSACAVFTRERERRDERGISSVFYRQLSWRRTMLYLHKYSDQGTVRVLYLVGVTAGPPEKRASCKRSVRYYTSDYRRLWCMYDAGCRAVRVRVTRSGRVWNEYFDYYYDSSLGDELCYVCTSTRTKEQCWCRFCPGGQREREERRERN